MGSVNRRHAGQAVAILALSALSASVSFAQDQFFDSAGVRIRCRTAGAGEPVVLLHGGLGSLESMKALQDALAAGYLAVAFDLRGHGGSGKPHDPKQYGLEMGKDALRLLDHLKIGKAHAVGFSLGGWILAKLLETDAERFLTVTLVGAAGMRNSGLRGLEELGDSLEQGKGFGPLLRARGALNPAGQAPPTQEQLERANAALTAMHDVAALIALCRGAKRLIADYGRIAAANAAIHAVVGDLDFMKEDVDALALAMPGLKLTVLPRTAHNVLMGRGYIAPVKEFLDERRAR